MHFWAQMLRFKGVSTMRRAIRLVVLSAALALVLAPAEARAEGFVSPFLGVNFGDEPNDGRTVYGVSAGGMGGGIIGGEFDFGYAPSFFGDADVFGSNNLMTLQGNLIIGIPIGGQTGGGVRPYVTGGLGIIRTDIDGLFEDDGVSNSDFAFNLGAGVMGFFSDHFGVRGDLRYFRTINSDTTDSDLDPEFGLGNFDFWRLAFGVVIR
jgi:opacity protein-like surface antigen